MNKKNVQRFLISKMRDPEEILKRVQNKYGSSGVVPNVEFPGKKWTLIGVSIILDQIIEKILVRLLGGAAGTALLVFQISSIFIDIVDPYGYSEVLSNADTEEAVKTVINQISIVLKDLKAEIRDSMIADINSVNIKFTEDDIDKIIDSVSEYWTESSVPMPPKTCYGDFETFKTLSGPPTQTCNTIYKEYYDKYLTENGEKYLKPANEANNAEVDKAISFIYQTILDNNLKTYRQSVLILNLIVVVLLGIFLFFYFNSKNK